MVDCWKSNRFEYPELEEMFIINMAHHNNNPELLARELASTLRTSRLGTPSKKKNVTNVTLGGGVRTSKCHIL